jgi:hypothetical protein
MKLRKFAFFASIFAIVLFGYSSASAQIVDAVKDAADKTKEVTKKTAVVVTDGVKDAAGKTKDATVKGTKTAAKKTTEFGSHSVEVTENVAEKSYEGGRFATVKTWDGSKWVAKRVWFASKKAGTATKEAVVGDDDPDN